MLLSWSDLASGVEGWEFKLVLGYLMDIFETCVENKAI